MVELGHVALRVRDLEGAIDFYGEAVGLKLVGRIAGGRAALLTAGRDIRPVEQPLSTHCCHLSRIHERQQNGADRTPQTCTVRETVRHPTRDGVSVLSRPTSYAR